MRSLTSFALSTAAFAALLGPMGCSSGATESVSESAQAVVFRCDPGLIEKCTGSGLTKRCACVPEPGVPITLATGSAPCGLAVDATHVYWTDREASTVQMVPIGGGTAVTLATGQATPGPIALLPQSPDPYVYWTTSGTVMVSPVASGTPVTIASGQTAPQNIAVPPNGDAIGSVFWSAGSNQSGSILRAPIRGGAAPVTLSSGSAAPMAMTVDATNVYWAENGALLRQPLAGGATVTIAASGFPPAGVPAALMLAVDASNLYVASNQIGGPSPATVVQVPLDGGAPITLATVSAEELFLGPDNQVALTIYNEPMLGISGIAVDADSVYYLANFATVYEGGAPSGPPPNVIADAVMKVPIGGGTPVTVASDQNFTGGSLCRSNSIAVDSTNVYWTMGGADSNSVMQIAK